MKISQELNIEIKFTLAKGGEEIFDIGNKQYLQVVSCLRDKTFAHGRTGPISKDRYFIRVQIN